MTRGNTNFLKVNNDLSTGRRSSGASPSQDASRTVLRAPKAYANRNSHDLSETGSTRDFCMLVISGGTSEKNVSPNRNEGIDPSKVGNHPFAKFHAGQSGSDSTSNDIWPKEKIDKNAALDTDHWEDIENWVKDDDYLMNNFSDVMRTVKATDP